MLEGEKVMLRGLELKDAETLWHYMNKGKMLNWLGMYRANSLEEEQDFVKKTWENRKKDNGYTWGVVEKATGKLVGCTSVNRDGHNARVAALGLWVGDDYWGKGYGTEALNLVMKYGFEHLDLYKVYAGAFKENEGSKKAQKKAGLKYQYTQRKHWYRNGKWQDLEYRDLLKEEYLQRKKLR